MKKYRSIIKWLPVLFAILLAVNVYLDLCFYRNYQEKIYILGQIFEADEQSKVDIMIGLLKQKDLGQLDCEKMKNILQEYGFTDHSQNIYYVTFVQQCAASAVCSILIAAAVLLFVYMQEKRWYKVQETYLKELEQCLILFRESEIINQKLSFILNTDSGLEDAVTRVNDQLMMLAEYLSMMREQSHKEKEETKELVTDLSHQLKTPVAALDTCFFVIEEQELNEEERDEFYERCRNELEGLKTLLDSLLQISQMEAGMIQLKCTRELILDTIVNAVNRIYPKASDKHMELAFDYEPEIEQLSIEHDAKWMCEVFINILDNAVKYSPAGSEIRISVQQYYSFVRIEIADEGIGIPKSDYHKIFKRFYRGGSSLVQKESGSGVGLYLAREIVNRHHGMISVYSDYEKRKDNPGSRFVVKMPL